MKTSYGKNPPRRIVAPLKTAVVRNGKSTKARRASSVAARRLASTRSYKASRSRYTQMAKRYRGLK